MKVIVTIQQSTDWPSDEPGDVHYNVAIEGGSSAGFGRGEPEDMELFRDLSDAYNIDSMVQQAWAAGLRGEALTIETRTEVDYVPDGEAHTITHGEGFDFVEGVPLLGMDQRLYMEYIEGYFEPEKYLAGPSLDRVKAAFETIKELENTMEERGLLEWC